MTPGALPPRWQAVPSAEVGSKEVQSPWERPGRCEVEPQGRLPAVAARRCVTKGP